MDSPPTRPAQPAPATTVAVHAEREIPGGWSYEVVVGAGEQARTHEVVLMWRDHDYWSGGASAPSRVVLALVEYVVSHADWIARGERLPRRFDAARTRRWLPQVDSELRGLI